MLGKMKIKNLYQSHASGNGKMLIYKTVLVIDHFRTGQKMKLLRMSKKLSLRKLAKKMKISAPYLSDLERGKRNWNKDRIKKYQNNLNK